MDKKEENELFLKKKQEFLDMFRHIRKNKGISIPKLAEQSGMDKGYLFRIERGEISPGLHNIIRLCTALGIELVLQEK